MASEFSTERDGASSEGRELEERIDELELRNRELEAENERLRSVTGPRVTYKAGALLLIAVSATAAGATAVYPGSRDVLIGLAGTGAFGAVLLGMLVQERLLSASVTRALYDTLWRNETDIASRLRLAETSRYVPVEQDSIGIRLYLSRSLDDPIPPPGSLGSTVVNVDGHYTLLLEPTGERFVDLFERTNDGLPENVRLATVVLREAVVQQFEIADSVEIVDLEFTDGPGTNRMRVRVWGSVLGDAARLDHPIRSFMGVALAHIVGRTVESESESRDDGSAVLTFRWEGEPPEPVD